MGTPLAAGRDCTAGDESTALFVAVVNETFIKRYLPDTPPLGQRLSVRGSDLQIVGVVKDVVYESLRDDTVPDRLRAGGSAQPDESGHVCRRRRPATLRQWRRRCGSCFSRDCAGAPVQVRTFGAGRDALIRERLMATLAGGLGLLALVLASVGLPGLLAYTVARRTNEIGVRMALGAARRQVLWLVVGDAGRLMALGTLLGLPAAWVGSLLMSSMLFGSDSPPTRRR